MGTTPKPASTDKPPKKPVYPREVTGLILIGILVLILTIVRYWHNIAWSAR